MDATTATNLLIAIAAITLVLPIAFLIAVAYAAGRRRRGLPVGGRLSGFITLLGGMSIGVFLLTGADAVLVALPILGSALLLAYLLIRRRRWVQAGQIVLGSSLPWALLWGSYTVGAALNPAGVFGQRLAEVVAWFAAGLAGVGAGAYLIRRGDPPAPAPSPNAPAGEPGSREYGTIAAAIREPGRVGPFGTSELAALVAFVIVWLFVPFLIPSWIPRPGGFAIAVVIASVVATEAYIRAMPIRSRRAFEAFSWLGEYELRQAGDSARDPVPTTQEDATEWLERHPDTPENGWLRVDVLLLARRYDEARKAAEALPSGTPSERWARAEALDSVDWRSGGDGDLASLEAAAAELEPADGDERLRAEVSIAVAKVRRRMADGRATAGDALDPLIEVRQKLGRRADGQVGRALRRRLLVTTLVVGLIFGGLVYVLGPSAGTLF